MEDHKFIFFPFVFPLMPLRFAPMHYGRRGPSASYPGTKCKPKSKAQKKKLRKIGEASRRRNRKAA